MAFYDRRKMWFGTLDRMQWIDTPLSGADGSPEGWSADGTNLNGGGFALHSWGSHKNYVYEWRESSSRKAAQLMKSYRDGSFGRGLLYFVEPTTYDTNLLPARWAAPSMACSDEGATMVYGLEPDAVAVSGGAVNELPVKAAYYDLVNTDDGYRGDQDTVFIPIPEGYTLHLGAFHAVTGSGKMYATPVLSTGALDTPVVLTEVAVAATSVVPDTFSGIKGVRLWLGKSAVGAASVTVTAMIARLYPTALTPPTSFTSGPWIGGQGHSGCRFLGPPTYITNRGIDGGQISYAASFKEVGSWS